MFLVPGNVVVFRGVSVVVVGAAAVATIAGEEVSYFCLLSFLLLLFLLSVLVQLFLLDASPGGLPDGASTMVGSCFTRIGASRCC